MDDPIRVYPCRKAGDSSPSPSAEDAEWLVGNGLGGYASGTVSGVMTRRYHGLLVAALPAPLGRTVMLNLMVEHLRRDGGDPIRIAAGQVSTPEDGSGVGRLVEFRLELGLPIWRFDVDGVVIERRLFLVHGQNTAVVTWTLLDGADRVALDLRPFIHFRPHETPLSEEPSSYTVSVAGNRWKIDGGHNLPPLRILMLAMHASLTLDGGSRHEVSYAIEARRGYDSRGILWNPGRISATLAAGQDVTLLASTESWQTFGDIRFTEALRDKQIRRRRLIESAHPVLRQSPMDELVLAADAFVIDPPRIEPKANTTDSTPHRTVIAGYHWFTDWGRDTMISLEGLTLVTGRADEARGILMTFAQNIRDGLIPNFFSEREGIGLYHTADATLWFFHALDRYLETTGDRDTLRALLPKLVDIIRHHRDGTRYGIGVDPGDGLLRQGAEGYQLTWMDAKVDDWVVTPRRGKAVEINALWYNALRLLERWVAEQAFADRVPPLAEMAEQARKSFAERFWYAAGGYLYDVVDGEQGEDTSCRPNQILALSLRNPVLDPSRWESVLDVVQRKLLTPVGLRSLASDHPDFRAKYDGDLRARDAAYHQGTVWAWLIGPFIDAWLRVHPERRHEARGFLDGLCRHLDEACLGSVSEIFDAEPPFAPRGCVAQAWSVAEVLRSWRNTGE